MHTFDRDRFFIRLNEEVSNPIQYNHLLALIVGELWDHVVGPDTAIKFIDGIGYFQDITRNNKWLSIYREPIVATNYGEKVSDRYLKVGTIPTAGQQGVHMPRPGTITTLRGKSRSSNNWWLEVRKNGVAVTLASLEIVGGNYSDDTIDIDFNAGDYLQLYCDSSDVEHPISQVDIAWRLII